MDKKTQAKYTELILLDSRFKDYVQIRTFVREEDLAYRFQRCIRPEGVFERGLTNYQELAKTYSLFQKALCQTVREIYDEWMAGKVDWEQDFRKSYFNNREKAHIKTVV